MREGAGLLRLHLRLQHLLRLWRRLVRRRLWLLLRLLRLLCDLHLLSQRRWGLRLRRRHRPQPVLCCMLCRGRIRRVRWQVKLLVRWLLRRLLLMLLLRRRRLLWLLLRLRL